MVLPPVFYPRNEVLTTRTKFIRNRTTSAQNNNLTNFTQSRFRQRKWDFLHKNDIDTIKNFDDLK